ncbi:SCO family protein [Sphingobium sp.]|uniref:SCO family protein n=1 Tax=Sphingobium sp. TaxID=1912891 RepID=UPI0028BE7CE6|nr:SCO family protein [Sphingobium sp.]
MVAGAPVARFSLVDHRGGQVSEADYAGSYLLVYFGFTHCKVVCPRSLAKLSAVLDGLEEKAAAITALYVTVDPERDTPEVMRTYLEANHPRFTGLTGSPEQIDRAKKAFRVFAERKADPDDPDGYVVPHSAIAYLMAPDGAYLDHFTDSLDPEEVTARIAAAIR